jgi:hypothetical protein
MLYQWKADVFANGQTVEECRLLKHVAPSGADFRQVKIGKIVKFDSVKEDFSRCWAMESDERFEEYGFSATAFADDGKHFSTPNRKRNVPQNPLVREPDADIFGIENRFHYVDYTGAVAEPQS